MIFDGDDHSFFSRALKKRNVIKISNSLVIIVANNKQQNKAAGNATVNMVSVTIAQSEFCN